MIGDIISAGANLVGGFLNRQSADRHNEAQIRQAELNRQMQLDFAQQGIRWKVDDAKAAGIHPLYALGANTVSYSPVSLGGGSDSSLGNAMAAAGQDLSRAINTTRTSSERSSAFEKTVQNLTLQKMGLENDLLASQVAKLRQTPNPPIPSGSTPGPVPVAEKFEDIPRLALGNGEFNVDRSVTNTDDATKRYGESADWWWGPYVMWRDYMANSGTHPSQTPAHRFVRKMFGRHWAGRDSFADRWKGE